ncbi:MAG: hypothetical protein ACC608_01625 [Anaerofustis sp.]
MPSSDYARNVFINCPYDEDYKGLMDAIIFTIIVLGYAPRLALESSDSAQNRIDRIIRLIEESQFSIHDLSRMVSKKSDEIFRLNMSLELGIDFGCVKLLPDRFSDKKLLVLDKEQYRFQQAVSDLSGIDIKAHNNNGAKIIECVRNWFAETVGVRHAPSAEKLYSQYTDEFQVFLLEQAKILGFNESNYINGITTPEYIDFVREWINR